MRAMETTSGKPSKPDVILVHRESVLGTCITVVRVDDFTLTATCRPGRMNAGSARMLTREVLHAAAKIIGQYDEPHREFSYTFKLNKPL